eukprot:gene1482-1869_t
MLSKGRLIYNNAYRYYSTLTTERVVEVSKLSTGLKVVSLTGGHTGPAVSMGVYIKTGSRNETHQNAGVNQVLKNLVFQSNHNDLGIQVQRSLEVITGGTAFAQSGRDNLLISSEVLPNYSSQVLTNLAQMTNPELPYHEVRDIAQLTGEESDAYNQDVYTQVFESLHKKAYHGKTLGRPLVAPVCNIENLDLETVTSYANAVYDQSNMVLVSVGLNHNDIVSHAEKIKFGRKSESPSSTVVNEEAKYTGGDSLMYQSGNTHVVLAFEGTSHKNTKDLVAFSVLQNILGNGSLSPKTAPGNGITSRLFSIVKNNPSVVKSECFNLTYGDSGLFGVYTEIENGNVTKLLSLLSSEISAASKVAGQELERAKALTKSAFLEQAESRRHALEFIGKQALYQDNILTPSQFVAEISKVTTEDIKRVAKKMLSSKPTLVVRGDLSDVPTIEDVQKMF